MESVNVDLRYDQGSCNAIKGTFPVVGRGAEGHIIDVSSALPGMCVKILTGPSLELLCTVALSEEQSVSIESKLSALAKGIASNSSGYDDGCNCASCCEHLKRARNSSHCQQLEQELRSKVNGLTPLEKIIASLSAEIDPVAVRPLEVVRDSKGKVVGYLMSFFEDSQSLNAWLLNNPSKKAVSIVLAALIDACEILHNHNIIIADLKPGNVLVSKDGASVKICDLDSACTSVSEGINITPAYTAPEIAERGKDGKVVRKKVNGKSLPWTTETDRYAMWVVIFESLYGFSPWSGSHCPKEGAVVRQDDMFIRGKNALSEDVRVKPAMAVLLGILPEDIKITMRRVFSEERLRIFPSSGYLRSLKWTKCTACEMEHAVETCPRCGIKNSSLVRLRVRMLKGIRFCSISAGERKPLTIVGPHLFVGKKCQLSFNTDLPPGFSFHSPLKDGSCFCFADSEKKAVSLWDTKTDSVVHTFNGVKFNGNDPAILPLEEGFLILATGRNYFIHRSQTGALEWQEHVCPEYSSWSLGDKQAIILTTDANIWKFDQESKEGILLFSNLHLEGGLVKDADVVLGEDCVWIFNKMTVGSECVCLNLKGEMLAKKMFMSLREFVKVNTPLGVIVLSPQPFLIRLVGKYLAKLPVELFGLPQSIETLPQSVYLCGDTLFMNVSGDVVVTSLNETGDSSQFLFPKVKGANHGNEFFCPGVLKKFVRWWQQKRTAQVVGS